MAANNPGMKIPTRPAPSLPVSRLSMVPSAENTVSDPFSPLRNVPIQQSKKKPPPRPPPPKLLPSQVSNKRFSAFGSIKKKSQKPAATAIVKPLPPASNIPIGTLIDLQSPPNSPQLPAKLRSSVSVGNISSFTNSTSLIESGFEDDFNSVFSSTATTPAFDPWSTSSDFTPSSSKTPSPDLMFTQHPAKNKNPKQILKNQTISKPTIICVPSSQRVKPNRPPPPLNSALCNINLDDDNIFLNKEGSPPMPSMPPPPPPPEALNIITSGPAIPPRPSSNKEGDTEKQPYCIAQFDYESSHPDDLNFKAGEVISLINDVDEEWLQGKITNKEGIFPKSYVKIVVPLSESNRSPFGMTVIAIYPFIAETWDDLDLKEGDKIKVLSRLNKDWLFGECDGKRGQFPECFVQDITDLDVDE